MTPEARIRYTLAIKKIIPKGQVVHMLGRKWKDGTPWHVDKLCVYIRRHRDECKAYLADCPEFETYVDFLNELIEALQEDTTQEFDWLKNLLKKPKTKKEVKEAAMGKMHWSDLRRTAKVAGIDTNADIWIWPKGDRA